jgi:hypothetical protein
MFFRSAKPIRHLGMVLLMPLLFWGIPFLPRVVYFLAVDMFNPVQDGPGRRTWIMVPADRKQLGQLRWLVGVAGATVLSTAYASIGLWVFGEDRWRAFVDTLTLGGFHLFAASTSVATGTMLRKYITTLGMPELASVVWALGLVGVLLATEHVLVATAVGVAVVWMCGIMMAAAAYLLCVSPLAREPMDQWIRSRKSQRRPRLEASYVRSPITMKSAEDRPYLEALRPFRWHAVLYFGFVLSFPVWATFALEAPEVGWVFIYLATYYTGESLSQSFFQRLRCYQALPVGQENLRTVLVAFPMGLSVFCMLYIAFWALSGISEPINSFGSDLVIAALLFGAISMTGALWLSNYLRLRNGDEHEAFLLSILMLAGGPMLVILSQHSQSPFGPTAAIIIVVTCGLLALVLLYRQCGDDRRPRRMAIVPEED